MTRLTFKQRYDFDVITDLEDRLAYALVRYMANDGHGDLGSCGVAEFNLLDFASALDWAPGATLRKLKSIAGKLNTVCVENENIVLFAMAGADQQSFDHLYKRCGFEGLPPNLPNVLPRFMRI